MLDVFVPAVQRPGVVAAAGPESDAFDIEDWVGQEAYSKNTRVVDRAATLVNYSGLEEIQLTAQGKTRATRSGSNDNVVSSPETLADAEVETNGRTASPSTRTFSDSEDSLGSRNEAGTRKDGAAGFATPAMSDFGGFGLHMGAVGGGPSSDPMQDVLMNFGAGNGAGSPALFAPMPTSASQAGGGPSSSSRKIKNPRRAAPGAAAAALATFPVPRPFTPPAGPQISGLAVDTDRDPALSTLKAQLDASRGVPALQRTIRVLGVPLVGAKSRVETQIKICLQLVSPSDSAADWSFLRIPEHMLASRDRQKRSRTQGSEGDTEVEATLDLQAEVVCASEPTRTVTVCSTCMQRERKRVRKRADPTKQEPEEVSDEADARRILLFNINSMVDFSGDVILPSRITCYCRHHNEKVGFCLYFTMRDYLGRIVGTGLSPPILITDDHKSLSKARTRKRPRTSIVTYSMESNEEASMYEREGSGIDEPVVKMEPADDVSFDSLRSASSLLPVGLTAAAGSQSMPASSSSSRKAKSQVVHVLPQGFRTVVDPSAFDGGRVGDAVISKVVPGEGPLHGGVDVTVLGTGFHNGLTVLFGSTPATATQYWNSNTLVVILPPGTTPGPVVVSFKDQQGVVANGERPLPIFVYKDESERAIMELALQVVGLRINGRIEDARDIALRIIGESSGGNGESSGVAPGNISPATLNLASIFSHHHIRLVKADLEDLLIDIFEKARHKAKYLLTVNPRGLSLLHLAVLADMPRLASWLSDEVGGILVDAADDRIGGWTALMWASWLGRNDCAEVLLNAGADGHLCDESGRSAWDLAVERGWEETVSLLEMHGLDEDLEEDDVFDGSGSEYGYEYSDMGSEYSYSVEGSDSDYTSDEDEDVTENEEVETTMVLPIMATEAEADVQPAPPGEIPAMPIPLPLAANNVPGSPIIRPPSAARTLEALVEEAVALGAPALADDEAVVGEAVPMDPAQPLPPQVARTARWFRSITSLGSAVQNIDVSDVARYPFANMPNPFRHFEMPGAVSGLFRRNVAAKAEKDAKPDQDAAQVGGGEGKNPRPLPAPMSLSVFSWVGQSSTGHNSTGGQSSQAVDGTKVAPAQLEREGDEEAVNPSEALAVVTEDASQGHDYTNLLWFWLPMAVLLASLATLRYLGLTEDIETVFLEFVDHYLFQLVSSSVQPVIGQGQDGAGLPLMHGPAVVIGNEFAVQPPLVAAVG